MKRHAERSILLMPPLGNFVKLLENFWRQSLPRQRAAREISPDARTQAQADHLGAFLNERANLLAGALIV
jgi:hypothetical protein